MENTPLLNIPLIMPSQAQAYVTHNEALMVLDGITQLAVIDRLTADPPGGAEQGDRYLVPAGATGVWAGLEGRIAMMRDGAWLIVQPRAGWRCWVESEQAELVFDGAAWIDAASASLSLHNLAGVGIGGTYDGTTPFVVHGPSSLFSGASGHQFKLNKQLADDTVSVLLQTGYSGRAEFGLAGDDDFHLKVSDDGSGWAEAMVIDRASGAASFPNTRMETGFRNLLINPRGLINQRGYASGAATSGANQYTLDRWRVVTSGQSLSWSEANGYRTFVAPAGGVEQVIEGASIISGDYTLSWAGTATAEVNGNSVSNGDTISLAGGADATVTFIDGSFALPQLERGAQVSAFELRPVGRELELCRYYFEVLGDGSVANPAVIIGKMNTPTVGTYVIVFAMKRVAPAITVSAVSDWFVNTRLANDAATAFSNVTNALQRSAALVQFTIGTPRGAGEACLLYGANSGAKMFIDAEL